jgi:HSP20 family protein
MVRRFEGAPPGNENAQINPTTTMRIIRYTYPRVRNFAPACGSFQRSPWSGLETEIDRLFESALGEIAPVPSGRFPVDLYEDGDTIYVRAELPGVNRADIGVELVADTLTITAVRKTPASEGQTEQSVSLNRSLRITHEVQNDKVTATNEHGVLTVTLPKLVAVKPTKITVAVK